jgi:hypothetical protein
MAKATATFKVERIEQSEGLRIKRDSKGNAEKAKRQLYDKKTRKTHEVEGEDVICEPVALQTIVFVPIGDIGPSDRLSLATTDPQLAKQFEVGKEYELAITKVGR